jgi:hypothetical protein
VSNSDVNYAATTLGIQTKYGLITSRCLAGDELTVASSDENSAAKYNCSSAFAGTYGVSTAGCLTTKYFTDDAMNNADTGYGVPNPFYFGMAVMEYWPGSSIPGPDYSNGSSSEILSHMNGGGRFVLLCNVTAYDIDYAIDDAIMSRFIPTKSNESVVNTVQTKMSRMNLLEYYLASQATFAWLSSIAEGMVDQITLAYSQAAAAMFSIAVRTTEVEQAERQVPMLVSRVHVAPLGTLLAANLLFVVAGVILLVLALRASGDEVHDIQPLLSVKGVVADRFEQDHGTCGVEELLDERSGVAAARIGIVRTENGYELRTVGEGQEDIGTSA